MISILPISKTAVKAHFKSLDEESRRCRFGMIMKDEAIDRFVDGAKGEFFGVMSLFYPLLPACVLHFVQDGDSAEVGVSTVKDHRGLGYARAIMSFAHTLANTRLVQKIVMVGIDENIPMKSLAKSCGFELFSSMGEFEASKKTNVGMVLDNINIFNEKIATVMPLIYYKS